MDGHLFTEGHHKRRQGLVVALRTKDTWEAVCEKRLKIVAKDLSRGRGTGHAAKTAAMATNGH